MTQEVINGILVAAILLTLVALFVKWIVKGSQRPTNKWFLDNGWTHVRNIYGDEINHTNARSVWRQPKGYGTSLGRELYNGDKS